MSSRPYVEMLLTIRKDTGQFAITAESNWQKLFRLDHEDEQNKYILVSTVPTARIAKLMEFAGVKMSETVTLRAAAPPKRDRWGRFTR